MNLKNLLYIRFPRFFSRVFFSCVLFITFFSQSDTSGADELPWPIQAPKHISSSFGEPRPGRFHLGLDFKSGGTTGKKVIALGDGYISRIQTTPFGYGKALYLTLYSGKIIVYGHLSGFLPEIEDRLFRMRRNKGSYDVRWYPKPQKYRVKKGQVIAYSGDTGSGPAHLHLEIRDKNNAPENPLNHGIFVRDTVAPVIESAALIPLDNTSAVDGFPSARLCDFSLSHEEPYVLSGRIGVAVSCYDRVNMSNNILGIYHISLAVDSTVVFSKTYDKIPYSLDRFAAFDNLTGTQYGGRGFFTALFRQTGNRLDFYEGDGALTENSLSPGMHILTVRVTDHAGNSAERSFPVVYGSRPFITACEFTGRDSLHIAGRRLYGTLSGVEIWKRHTSGDWLLFQKLAVDGSSYDTTVKIEAGETSTYKVVLTSGDNINSMPAFVQIAPKPEDENQAASLFISTGLEHDRIVVHITSTDILASLPEIRVGRDGITAKGMMCLVPDGETSWVTSLGFPQSDKSDMCITASAYTSSLKPVKASAKLEFTACDMTSEVTVHAPDSLFTLTVSPESLYRPTPVIVDTISVKPSNGLEILSQGYRVVWGDEPLKGSCDIALKLLCDPPEKAALYSSGNGNGWKFLSDVRDGRVFTGKPGGSGYVAVMVDRLKPYVRASTPRPGSTIKSRRPLLRARVQDKGSGIEGSDSISMSIDGIAIYGEYDYEADWVSYRLHNPLSYGNHTVKVTVTDRMGNSQTRSWKFRIEK